LEEDTLWLFGSRVKLDLKGGDIDLYIETNYLSQEIAIEKKLDFLVDLKKQIGDQKIDVIIRCSYEKQHLPIWTEAIQHGVQLK
jgi:predicted nucleotidyltransferase